MDLTPLSHKEASRFVLNHFIVTGNMPSDKGNFTKTIKFSCAVPTIDDAIALARKKKPGLIIYSITHQGAIEGLEER